MADTLDARPSTPFPTCPPVVRPILRERHTALVVQPMGLIDLDRERVVSLATVTRCEPVP